MKVLKPTTDSQTIKVIPRNYDTSLSVSLRDDQTNVTVAYTPTVTKENDYLVYEGVFNLEEGHYYDFLVGSGVNTNVVDKIFCTNQTIDQSNEDNYTVNKNVYTHDTTFDNEYIVYEG